MPASHTLRGRIEAVQTIVGQAPAPNNEPLTVLSILDPRGQLRIAYGGPALLEALLALWPQGLIGHQIQIQLHGHTVDTLLSLEASHG